MTHSPARYGRRRLAAYLKQRIPVKVTFDHYTYSQGDTKKALVYRVTHLTTGELLTDHLLLDVANGWDLQVPGGLQCGRRYWVEGTVKSYQRADGSFDVDLRQVTPLERERPWA